VGDDGDGSGWVVEEMIDDVSLVGVRRASAVDVLPRW
jgi:hypothetical protein